MSWRLKWAFLTQICPCQHNLFTFLSSPPERGQFHPNLAQSIPTWLMRIQECSNMDHTLSKGRGGVNHDIYTNRIILIALFKFVIAWKCFSDQVSDVAHGPVVWTVFLTLVLARLQTQFFIGFLLCFSTLVVFLLLLNHLLSIYTLYQCQKQIDRGR